jgi:hypothetical protein
VKKSVSGTPSFAPKENGWLKAATEAKKKSNKDLIVTVLE